MWDDTVRTCQRFATSRPSGVFSRPESDNGTAPNQGLASEYCLLEHAKFRLGSRCRYQPEPRLKTLIAVGTNVTGDRWPSPGHTRVVHYSQRGAIVCQNDYERGRIPTHMNKSHVPQRAQCDSLADAIFRSDQTWNKVKAENCRY